ncbi:PAS domain-containing sensor histidine kinase [Legionella oakridgensis]|nr:PAS domain S-box protein [Legionella oakridgensis]ETO93858.1 PAS/PAC sensor signal transduction histidine kinase [Legionella oakridgensis RV-2-2007]KTD43995.1 two-component sensor histidine kinase [Legionella oakridgensis]STY19536.1 two-component sensor histidine kinase [Legionella longbeachae]
MERKAADNEAFYAAIIQSSNDAIIGKDLNGIITSWNMAAEHLFGYTAAEMVGASITCIISSDRKQDIYQLLKKIKEDKKVEHYETVCRKKDGTEVKLSISLSPIKDHTGKITGAASIARKIPFVTREQRKFELAIEAAPNGMLMIDDQGNIKLVNAQLERMFEYAREELLGNPIEMLVPERFRAMHPRHRQDFFKNPKARFLDARRELYGLKKDGTEFPVEIGLNPLITEEGSFVLASVVDITARKREQEKFRLAIESTPAGILMVNKLGEIELANEQVLEMFKYTKEGLIGQRVEILVPERFRATHPQYRNVYYQQPETRAMGMGRDLYGLRMDGTEFPVEIGLNPLKTESGMFVLASIIDITERKATEDKIRRSNTELEHFAYVVSHDLKAPLRGIATLSEWIIEEYQEKLDEKGQHYLELLDSRVKRLQSLIDGILEYSRIGRIEEEPQEINLNRIIEDVKEVLAPPKHIRIEIQKNLPVIYGAKTNIHQLFQNLISNAIKYNDKKQGRIEIGAFERPKEWEFFVKDNGIGIDEQYKDKIFELFQTLADKEQYESTGIGLTLAKKIVELYNGKIWFKSMVGRGTTFYFTLNKEKIREEQ